MTPETLKQSKKFKTQCGVCSIITFSAYAFICYMNPIAVAEALIMPIGGIVLGIIYLNMRSMIKRHESEVSALKSKSLP